MTLALVVLLGLALGSFINALVWRLHEGKDFVASRSECVHCHHQLSARDLVPVFSWIMLQGKCRYCHEPISIQYPIVESLTAISFGVSYLFWPEHLTNALDVSLFISWLIQLVILISLFVYDLKWYLLPNKLTYTLIAVALAEQIINTTTISELLLNTFIGVLVGSGLFYLIFMTTKGKGIGGGDVKLGVYLGLALGWQHALIALLVAFYSATLFSLPLILMRKVNRKSKIPFGPFIILGIVIAKLFGETLFSWLAAITGMGYYL